MINRRILRIKAFQALYSYHTQERARYQLAFDELDTIFLPDLSLMISKEDQMPKLEGLKKLAEIQLSEFFNQISNKEEIPAESYKAAQQSFNLYQKDIKSLKESVKAMMLDEVHQIYRRYLKVLYFIQELGNIGTWDENRRLLESPIKTSNLAKNKILQILPKWVELQNELSKNQIGWTEDEENLVKKVFIEGILVDEQFIEYLPNAGKTFEKDIEMIQYLLKNFLLKHAYMAEYFEEKDLNWHLNRDIVKSLSSKTFKAEALEDLKLQDIALQWDEDEIYFKTLFETVIDEDQRYEKWIEGHTENWESERLATTDLIILKMAIAEMIKFSSIPIKVSINEYIELAKNYSTPKSGLFINGVLDVLSSKLVKEKVINKSGRGLIDIASK
jgi:N utilization substance protein B